MPQVGLGAVLAVDRRLDSPATTHTFEPRVELGLLEAARAPGQFASRIQHEAAALEDDLVLPAHQVRVHQRQASGAHALAHGGLALAALAGVERRGVDHREQFGASGARIGGRRVEPGVLADEQAHTHRAAVGAGHVEHTGALARHEVAALVEHLVVGQLALGVGGDHAAFAQHAGRVVQRGHRHAAPARAVARARRMTHHDVQAFELRRGGRHRLEGIITGVDERGPQVQVFGGVAADGEFGREQQPHPTRVRGRGGLDDAAGIACHVAHHEVELGNRYGKRHGIWWEN